MLDTSKPQLPLPPLPSGIDLRARAGMGLVILMNEVDRLPVLSGS